MTWPEYLGWREFFHADERAGPWTPDDELLDLLHGRALYAQTDGKKPFTRFILYAPPDDPVEQSKATAARVAAVHSMLSAKHDTIKRHPHTRQRAVQCRS